MTALKYETEASQLREIVPSHVWFGRELLSGVGIEITVLEVQRADARCLCESSLDDLVLPSILHDIRRADPALDGQRGLLAPGQERNG